LLLVLPVAPAAADDGTATPSGSSTTTSDPRDGDDWRTHGRITPTMRAEIDRVVAEGAAPVAGRRSAAASAARCATFAGERYCLGLGWTTLDEQEAQARLDAAARRSAARRAPREHTGDLD